MPFGDQIGHASPSSLSVSWVTPVPSAFITKVSKSPSRSLVKAICLPSGDHAGDRSSSSLSVSWVTPVPSAFITKIS